MLTGINQDSKSFKGRFNKDWFDNITPPLGSEPPEPAEGDGRENEFEAGITREEPIVIAGDDGDNIDDGIDGRHNERKINVHGCIYKGKY